MGMHWGSADEHKRYMVAADKASNDCGCGCNGPATQLGMANGVCLTSGCEMRVRRWVRDGPAPRVGNVDNRSPWRQL